MATVQGNEEKLEIYNGASYDQICTTSLSLDRNNETDDVTNMCSERFKETASETRTYSVSADGVYDTTDAGYSSLKAAYDTGDGQILAQYTEVDGDVVAGTLQINSLTQSASHNQEVRWSLSGDFTGTVTVS